jgi:hypothetical protein
MPPGIELIGIIEHQHATATKIPQCGEFTKLRHARTLTGSLTLYEPMAPGVHDEKIRSAHTALP